MVIMDPYYSPDRLQEIWQNIDHLHLSYLEMEESPEKLEHRIRLEDCIKEYLCIASHSQKFCFRETAEVLHRSASNKKDFSGYKAATGWNAIQLYAGNLLSQPWRKEYRQIKTYCGFYKHQIEANLVGADIMFEAMGYKHCGNGILILDGPICPDQVAMVSKDCLIAYVECQILKAIWEELSQSFNITWIEVLEFRRSHLCSPEQSIRALNYQFHQKQYQNRAQHHQAPPLIPFQPISYPCYAGNSYATYAHVPYVYPQPIMTNGYIPQPPPPIYSYGVPTGQLIELDNHNNSYDVVDRPRTRRNSAKNHDLNNKNESYEDWDYVYRNLESKGYSKDLGERGDILNKTKTTNLDEAMHNLNVASEARPLKIAEALEKYDNNVGVEAQKRVERKSESSSYENLSDNKRIVNSKTKTLPPMRDKVFNNVSSKEGVVGNNSKTLDLRKKNKWECKTCTYLNENTKEICEMCSKSRVNVEQQMEIGGPQCSKCTLVNLKDAKVCQACGCSLKDSPTYI